MHGDEAEAARLRAELPPSLLRAMEDKSADKYEIGGEGVALMVGRLIGFWLTR